MIFAIIISLINADCFILLPLITNVCHKKISLLAPIKNSKNASMLTIILNALINSILELNKICCHIFADSLSLGIDGVRWSLSAFFVFIKFETEI